MRIAFVWQGITGRYGVWKDGLYAAMKLIEQEHTVTYHEPTDTVPEDAFVLYWEAACTINGKDAVNYNRVRRLPNKKALLFAGGPIRGEWLQGFDHVFYESKINGDELRGLGVSCSLAFGINEKIMQPAAQSKIYDGMHHGTCASWKRQWLVGEALHEKGLVVGRHQPEDQYPFDRCKELGCNVLPEQQPEEICNLLNQSMCCLQTSDYWGGGQRCTLEALACNVPVVCMKDSPKNCEYVEESGFGLVVDPEVDNIRKAVEEIKTWQPSTKGRDYIMTKWTSKHYAEALLNIIKQYE
jgi:hypothetical protein